MRKSLKWSQNDLAQKVGTSAPIIGRYECGEIKPSIEMAAKIADALWVTTDYLLGRSDKIVLDKKILQSIESLSEDDKQNFISHGLLNRNDAMETQSTQGFFIINL